MTYRVGMVVLLLLAACSRIDEPGPFPVVGKFDDYNEVLSGDFRVDLHWHTSPRGLGTLDSIARAWAATLTETC